MNAGPTNTMLSIEPNPAVTFGIAHQDDDLLVVEKPARVPTQPGKGHSADTLLNGLFARFGNPLQNLGKARDFGLLHRLDRETSGLLIVGLRPAAYDAMRVAFEKRWVRKFYWAICAAAPREPRGVIRMPIVESDGGHENSSRQKLARVARVGKPAATAYRVLDSSPMGCLIEARPVTGRLHQVRVHLEAIGCPILGDKFYGPRRVQGASARLALHAHRVGFIHPTSGEPMDIRTDWPKDLRRLLRSLGLDPRKANAEAPGADQASDEADE
ncbi:MAG: RluA family pseudouridine synthase [Phycisphaerales bacterium]|nr:RluA family pseudouridine synthase [Phycisphaerales bacterium]